MKRIIVLNPSLVWVEGNTQLVTLDSLLATPPKGTLVVGVIPSEVGRVLATERTLDAAMTLEYPGENSFSSQPLATNVHQVYVSPDALLAQLRQLSNDVRIVPYPAAVLTAVSKQRPKASIIERTQVFLGAKPDSAKAEGGGPELLVIDTIIDDYLMTGIRGNEVVSVRFARGDLVTEVQRTLASARMDAPKLLCSDQQVSLELQSQGFDVETLPGNASFIGANVLNRVESARFLNRFEVAQMRRTASRRKAAMLTGVAACVLVVAAVGWFLMDWKLTEATTRRTALEAEKQGQLEGMAAVYAERYGSAARARSLKIRDEVFDLLTVLPPQVTVLSVKKDPQGTSAIVERSAQAAPFNTNDLVEALQASTYFAKAKIAEEYDGHLIRYNLTLAPPPAP
jgi:hypothetical protein